MTAPDRVMWKYTIPIATAMKTTTTAVFDIPGGARFRHCATQRGDIALWYEITDPDAPTDRHKFRVFGTGVEGIPDRYSYIGTTLHYGGDLVLHVYEADR